MEILIEEMLKAVKRTYMKMEIIKEKLNKIENRMINIEIPQNTLLSIGKDPKYVTETTGKVIEHIIFGKYLERTIKNEDIEKGNLDKKLLEQYLELERKIKIKEGKQIIEESYRTCRSIPSKIKEEYLKTFEKQYKILKYEPKETKIKQLGNT